MSHSQAIQGLTLKPDMLVDDNDINDREVLFNFLFFQINFSSFRNLLRKN